MICIRICVIGCGNIARAAHGPSLVRLQREGLCRLAGCCARHLETAVSFQQRFGFEKAYDDYELMLAEQRPDAVLVLMPARQIAACAAHVMELGYPVILEKPPGISVQETDMLIRTAERTGVFSAVAFNRRSMPLVLETKRLLAGHKIDFISLEMCRYRRTEEDFTTTAIHGIDCLSFLTGAPYASVRCRYQPDAARANTNYFISGHFANGTGFDMRFLPDAGAVTERIGIYTRGRQYYLQLPVWSGTEYTDGFDCPGSLVCVEDQRAAVSIGGDMLSRCEDRFVLNGFYDEDRLVLEALRDGLPSPFPIGTGRQSVEISALLRAGTEGKTWEE